MSVEEEWGWDPRDGDCRVSHTDPKHYQGMEALVTFLATDIGQRGLEWLKSITTERTLAATFVSDAALWHLEGQRALVLKLKGCVDNFIERRH